MRAAVVGTTAWGTTLAVLLARNEAPVSLLARSQTEAERIGRQRENERFMPGVELPASLSATASAAQALEGADIVVIAVPSRSMEANLDSLAAHVPDAATVVSATKGIDISTGMRMTELIEHRMEEGRTGHTCAISGPNLASEVAAGLPSTAVVAGDAVAAGMVQSALASPSFRVYTNSDIVGVELGGALKNIVAIGAGICDGLQLGDNAKAAFVTRGLAETARLGVAAGANPLTIMGLAGMGDMMATCYSSLSRNRSLGEQLASGRKLGEIRESNHNLPEGVSTTEAAVRLAERLSVDMPIALAIHSILFDSRTIEDAIADLMEREPAPELGGQ